MQGLIFFTLVALTSAEVIDFPTLWKADNKIPPSTSLEKLEQRDKRVPDGWVPPETFDSRTQWPFCPSIGDIQDQGDCEAEWGTASATAMSDRACIHSNGTDNFKYAIQNLLTCCAYCGNCYGGNADLAFEYWIHSGIVSGGPYNSGEGCQPYTIRPKVPVELGNFREGTQAPTPPCKAECQESYNATYFDDLRYGQDKFLIPNDTLEIMYEILTHGPVVASFDKYVDFEVYAGGIYYHDTNLLLGRHAAKIIGWGFDGETQYWIAANSWSTEWGEDGFFRILKGSNECGIEDQVVTGTPKSI